MAFAVQHLQGWRDGPLKGVHQIDRGGLAGVGVHHGIAVAGQHKGQVASVLVLAVP